ncbi:putative membrane protein [Pedococcus dokdonensis]|uniref:Putative membrane protein n=1 Tax=Pedococcus dokdonensis TaxID=443156 RepID=A0A1H0PXC4_9MICO|nr:PH domain-containing protein [Pedococcus dokdonensis]SDP09704.1 putative membrane protein [Pedococcus dokdonensis]
MTTPGPGPALAPAEPQGEWRHLHPLSPLLKGGIAFLAVVAYVVSQQADSLFGADRDDPTQGHLGLAALGVLVVLVAIIAGAWVSWRFSRFRVADTLIELRTGVLFRQHRQVRFDRIQAVDLGRPLLARLTGLSEVVVQSAGGKDSHLKLSFLTDAQAQQVREQLMALAGRSDEVTGPPTASGTDAAGLTDADYVDVPAPAPPGDQVLTVPNARILQSVLYSGPGLVIVVAVPALLLSIVLGVPEMVAWLGPMTLAVGSAHLKRLTQECNFEVLHQGDRLRIRHGLTDLRTTTVPLHRIQAVEVSQSLPWRLPGWWRIQVNVAGAGTGDDVTQTVLMPVGTRAEALRVLALVHPGIPADAAVAALEGEGTAEGFVTSTERARRLDPLSWRRQGYAVLPVGLLTRRGALWRAAQFVPHARIQSLKVEQGPAQRRRGVATVRIVSTVGPVSPVVAHLDEAEAVRLLSEQVVRSSLARQRA